MFKVLYTPFDKNVKGVALNASSAIVWESHKGQRALVSNISTSPETQASLDFRFETTAECLNSHLLSLEFKKEMLRSIVYTWKQGEMHRRGYTHLPYKPRQPPFAPNNDWGRGGSGVDGYW